MQNFAEIFVLGSWINKIPNFFTFASILAGSVLTAILTARVLSEKHLPEVAVDFYLSRYIVDNYGIVIIVIKCSHKRDFIEYKVYSG